MKPPGPGTPTASGARAVYAPGPRLLLGCRPGSGSKLLKLQVFVLLPTLFAPVTAGPVHDVPSDLQRVGQNPSEGLCQAGQYRSESGKCRPCEDGRDFTSAPNNMSSCIPCSVCKEDKYEESRCTSTRDTVCQCNSGTYEDKDSTEHCQKCSECTDGEKEDTACTPKTDRICVPQNTWTFLSILGVVFGVMGSAALVLLGVALAVRPGTRRSLLQYMKSTYQGPERARDSLVTAEPDKDSEGRGQDPESATTTVRMSLLSTQPSSLGNDSHYNVVSPTVEAPEEPEEAENSPTGRKLLVPANENDPVDALKLIFNCCPDIVPFNSWDRLMRHLGLTDNEIQMVRAETQTSRDVLYQMLLKWLNQTGRSASINHLLDALEAMGERCALDRIEDHAVKSGTFTYQQATVQPGVLAHTFDCSTQEAAALLVGVAMLEEVCHCEGGL
ncbi:tumor necrosis factor receptor superfamily member 10B-like [Acomys russatus]|uniref:tumor necrosis factor receptor superfamily member 10B-like n=1 Tax=Acomys russatus TaxID=60746 RepID=UPI0021E1C1B5|nr:tumor necrosis factor receptor superfamily member 10B-like [Acomys russatus]